MKTKREITIIVEEKREQTSIPFMSVENGGLQQNGKEIGNYSVIIGGIIINFNKGNQYLVNFSEVFTKIGELWEADKKAIRKEKRKIKTSHAK